MSRSTFRVLFYLKRNAPKKRNDFRDAPYHGERKDLTVKQQAGREKNVERGAWQADRPQPRGIGGKPYTGQDAAWHQQDVSGSMRHRRVCHGGEGAQRLPGSAPAGRVQVAQRGLCEAGRQDEEHSYWKYCVVYI